MPTGLLTDVRSYIPVLEKSEGVALSCRQVDELSANGGTQIYLWSRQST